MIITCPKCSVELEVPDDVVGRKVRCGACQEKFVINADGTTSPVPSSAPTPPPPPPPPARDFNLPIGAQWDVPSENDYIGTYCYEISTTGFCEAEVDCEGCHQKFKVTFRNIIDATDESRFEDAIASGDYFKFKCPHCGKTRIVVFKVFVWNLRKNYFMRTIFDDKELQTNHQKKSITPEAMGLPSGALSHVRQRLVWGIPGLMEKMKVFKAGLVDYVVEMQKIVLEHRYSNLGIAEIYFDSVEGDELKWRFDLKDDRSGHVGSEKEMYDDIKTKMAEVGPFKEGILRWVHWRLMKGNYDDWFE